MHHSGDPGMLQTTIYWIKEATGLCTLHMSWTPPNNIAISDLSHFMIDIDGELVLNISNTNNKTVFSAYHPVCSCGAHRVIIRAVNHCGREGAPSNFVNLFPEIFQHNLVCDVNDTIIDHTSWPDEENYGKN